MNDKLSWKQRLARWGLAVVWIAAGAAFAWKGLQLFALLGLPVWSDGDHGWNYVGVTAYAFFVVGISLINSTLTEKVRAWIWGAVVVATLLTFL